ncbi:hypothetical protein DACRYDRAFT_24614 [Dacryopinax primogenitus]|uniref:Uncharacterized protein n=1 Tax=Dacryopinax primogenitus (strain DJM 731) TaxID=1858805 RepID=M5FX74_DACPD|nr:uncharacterized protein DACRYDRAFT_24614 [Dacryopinax primogenitus]EJT98076.1 hypothetical protein DACRYDRAFT_24614 [Dacryopinax primogenitus]
MPDNFSSSACQADKQRLLEFLHAIPDIQSYRASLLIIVHGDFFSGSTALICRNLGLDTLPPSVQDARVVTLKNESVWVPEIEDSLMSLQFDVFGLPIEGTSPRDCMDHLIMLWGQKLWDALPELPGTPIIQPMFQAFISGIDVASSQLWKMSVQADSPCPLSLPSFAHRRTSTWKQAIEAVGEYLQQPVFGHGYAISQARQFLHQLAGQVAKAPKTYGIEVFPIFEHIGNHVAGMIIADSSRVTFRDEFLGRDLLPALQKNVRSNWAAVIADFNIAYQSLPQCSSPLLSTKRERGDDPLVGEDMKMSPPKRTKIGQNNVSVVNGALSAPRTTSTRPKKGTLHSLRARIKLANALAAGETDGH